VNNKSFFWEIKDILTQFIAAFDDTVIKRFDGDRNHRQSVEVRYVFAPKQRVMHDIVNKTHNITLPVVTIDVSSIKRDNSRVFNKIEPSYYPGKLDDQGFERYSNIVTPVPINIEVNMSILTKYMNDMDQIISNFVPYSNPYIILAWKTPKEFELLEDMEIRSEVLWNENLTYNNPTDISYTDKFRIAVDTSFTIKTWLFRETSPSVPIYEVDTNLHGVANTADLEYYSDYDALTSYTDPYYSTYSTTSAAPMLTNLFYSTSGTSFRLDRQTFDVSDNTPTTLIAYGVNLDRTTQFYISGGGDVSPMNEPFKEISTNIGSVSGYSINNNVNILNRNTCTLHFPASSFMGIGKFKLLAVNSAGWDTSDGYINITD
jgi:hypothetical protein